MRLVAIFGGSRGDVQPGVALALELVRRGHDVTLAVPPNLVDFATRAGLDAHPCGVDTAELLASDVVSRDLKSANPLRRLSAISELTVQGGRRVHTELLALARSADAVLGSSVGQERACNVAERLSIPYVPVHYCPVRRNSRYSFVGLPRALASPVPTGLSWAALDRVLWWSARRAENALRAEMGLDPVKHSVAVRLQRTHTTEIQAYDRLLFPGLADEWAPHRPLVGFFDLAASTRDALGERIDDDLDAWLPSGTPPIYVGFGSMRVPAVASATAVMVRAAVESGHRVLVCGTDVPPDLRGEHVRIVDSVDHSTVFPRCAAVVHHGGAGSTAAGLRAGRPTLVCAIGADQPLWGRRVADSGVGLAISATRLTPARAASAVNRLVSRDLARAAAAFSARLVPAATAVAAAADLVERSADTSRSALTTRSTR